MTERFLRVAEGLVLRKRAGVIYESLAARGSYDWLSAYHQAIAEATVRPGDAGWCYDQMLCPNWSTIEGQCQHPEFVHQGDCPGYREGHCPKEAK